MQLIDLTPIVLAIIALAVSVVTVKVVPVIKAKLTSTEIDNLVKWASIGVKAAEQLYKNGSITKEERKAKVLKFLQYKGYNINLDEVDAAIESSVNDLPHLLVSESDVTEVKEVEDAIMENE
jgi:hypothetical protein